MVNPKKRGIFGEATRNEVRDLVTEGVDVAPLPEAKKKTDKAGEVKTPAIPDKKLN